MRRSIRSPKIWTPILGCSLRHCPVAWPQGLVPMCHYGDRVQGRLTAKESQHQGAGLAPHMPLIWAESSAFLPWRVLSYGWGPPLPTMEMSLGPNSKQGSAQQLADHCLQATPTGEGVGCPPKIASRKKDHLKEGAGGQGMRPEGACQDHMVSGTTGATFSEPWLLHL